MADSEKRASRREFLTAHRQLVPPVASDDASLTEPVPPQRRTALRHFSQRAMACDFQFFFDLDSPGNTGQFALDGFAEVERLESCLTIYRSDSEVSLLNRWAAREPQPVSLEVAELLELALRLSAETRGAFDITSTPLSRVWGFLERSPRVPPAADLARALAAVSWKNIAFDPATRTLQFLQPTSEINFHGIGKGYALDRVARLLVEKGVPQFALHGGQSSVLVRSQDPTATPWVIGLTHPLIPQERIGELHLNSGSLSTSGSARQGLYHQGTRLSHVIDPRTGSPVDHHLSVTVWCAEAAVSDALATAFMVMTTAEVAEYCQAHPDVKALIFCPAGHSNRPWELHSFNVADSEFHLFDQ